MKWIRISLVIIFHCFSTRLLADTTLVVLNNQGCYNCYADVSNLKNQPSVFVYVNGYSAKKSEKYVKKYFSGLGFMPTIWCPPELVGLEGTATIKQGEVHDFLPIGWHYSLVESKPIDLSVYTLSENLIYSASGNSIIIKDKDFNECIFIVKDSIFTINVSDSILQYSVYSRLGLLKEREVIISITDQLGGGLNDLLIMGDVQVVKDKVYILGKIRRFGDNSLYTQPLIVILNDKSAMVEILQFPAELNYRIGTNTFDILDNGDYDFIVSLSEDDERSNGYNFIYTFTNEQGLLRPIDTLDIKVDQFFDGSANSFNSTAIKSANNCWAYTVIPCFYCSESNNGDEIIFSYYLYEYNSFRLGYDAQRVFQMDYKFKGITKWNNNTYVIFYRFLDDLKFKIISNGVSIGFGSLGKNDVEADVFLSGNYIYTIKNDRLTIQQLFTER